MKMFIFAALAALGFATASSAGNFERTTLVTTVVTQNLEFSLGGVINHNGAVGVDNSWAVSGGAYVLPHTVGSFSADVFVFGAFGEVSGTGVVGVGADYRLTRTVDNVDLAFVVQGLYVAPTDDLGDGYFVVTPSANAQVEVSDRVAVFGEVGYSWIASEDFARAGGYAQVGVDLKVADGVAIRPSVIRTFDTGADDTQAAIEVVFSF